MKVLRNEDTLWELIKRFYKETFDIPEYIIECFSLLDILKRCVSGYSTTYISRSLQLPTFYIRDALSYCLNFEGWESDLDFNALACYNRANGDYNGYFQEVSMVSIISDVTIIRLSYNLCKRYYEILDEVDKYVR